MSKPKVIVTIASAGGMARVSGIGPAQLPAAIQSVLLGGYPGPTPGFAIRSAGA